MAAASATQGPTQAEAQAPQTSGFSCLPVWLEMQAQLLSSCPSSQEGLPDLWPHSPGAPAPGQPSGYSQRAGWVSPPAGWA